MLLDQKIETGKSRIILTMNEKASLTARQQRYEAMMELRSFLFSEVYRSAPVQEQTEKARRLLTALFDYYVAHVDEVPAEYRALSGGDDLRAVTDYIAGMTDRYATHQFNRIFIPSTHHDG